MKRSPVADDPGAGITCPLVRAELGRWLSEIRQARENISTILDRKQGEADGSVNMKSRLKSETMSRSDGVIRYLLGRCFHRTEYSWRRDAMSVGNHQFVKLNQIES